MAANFLNDILDYKRSLLKQKKAFYAVLKVKIKDQKLSQPSLFKKAISKPGPINLIAEIKKASPSRGMICPHFDVLRIAEVYARSGAAAISVLTEDKFFLGKPGYLKTLSKNSRLPLLAKDFIIDEVQIIESFYLGASAVLLIVAILNDDQLKRLLKVASGLGLDALVEIHNAEELTRALNAGADMIGVNNRDLRTFEVDLRTSEKLIPKIPKGKVIVSESGLKSHNEIVLLKDLGVHAVLIGETFLESPDIEGKIKEVMQGMEK